MKRILIIGGNGFIGSNLTECLSQKEYSVKSFDIQEPHYPIKGVQYITGDFFDNQILESILVDTDVVIHALSTVNPGNSNIRFMQGYSRDFVQSAYLFSLCQVRKIKVIFLSSGGTVYGVQENQPIREEAFADPINHYGTVKLCIENVLRTFNKQSHSQMIVARISNPYGPGQDFNKGVGFVDAALKKSLSEENIEIWGDGSVIRDYIYIKDVCEMIASLIEYEGDEDTFNVASGKGISLNEIIEEIIHLGLKPKIVYKESRSVDVPKVILDNSKIEKIHPMNLLSFHEGLKLYYEFLLEKYQG